jgi:glucosylceramidase
MPALLAAGAFAAPATAGVVTRSGPVSLNARGLTAAERQAITVVSAGVIGDDSLGAVVWVTFRGGVEQYLGRGHLRSGLLALVLLPARDGVPTGLVDEGGKRVSRITPARPAGVVGRGHTLTFYLAGARLSAYARVEVKLFVTGRPNSAWREILASKPAERVLLRVDPSQLTCSQLTALANKLRPLRALGTFGGMIGARLVACAAPTSVPPPTTATTATTTTTTSTTTTTPPPPPSAPPVTVVQTDEALSQQLASQPGLDFSAAPPGGVPVIGVSDQIAYQRFSGLGAALTDTAAWLIYDELSSADRTTVMQDLFGAGGINLGFLRIAMGASGAMTNGPAYSYDDMPAGQSDPTLSQFTTDHDLAYIIPTLQQARAINPALEILANPWSPPGWMKDNDSLGNQNDSGTLRTDEYGALASYFVKVIQSYAAQGVPIDAVTAQNEPRTTGSGTAYPGLTLPEPAEAQFISQNLGPTLAVAGLHTKIYGNDLSWDSMSYANGLVSGPAATALSGVAWHCYFGSPTVMSQLGQIAPSLDQIVDECSPEIRAFGAPEFLISSLRNWASVVAVWTVALDPNGGPIQPGNNCGGCRGLVTIDEDTHTMNLRNEYYELGQVSEFVQPGARRIDSPDFVTYGVNASNIETVTSGLDDVAFLNPDGSKVLVTYNNSTAPISFAVASDGRYFTYTSPAQAMTTFVWR